jgi:hypothetical protein
MAALQVPALCYAFNNNVAILLQLEMDSATFQVLNFCLLVPACMQ